MMMRVEMCKVSKDFFCFLILLAAFKRKENHIVYLLIIVGKTII